MIEKSKQKFKGLKNKKSFQNEIKSSVCHFERAFSQVKTKQIFLEGENPFLTHLPKATHYSE